MKYLSHQNNRNYNLFKGYYFDKKIKISQKVKNLFPNNIDNNIINMLHLESVMNRINIKWDKIIFKLFLQLVNKEYEDNRSLFMRIYTIYKNLFELIFRILKIYFFCL